MKTKLMIFVGVLWLFPLILMSQPFGQLVRKFKMMPSQNGNICSNNNYLFVGNYRNNVSDTIFIYSIATGNLVGSQKVTANGSSGGYGIKATYNRMYLGSDEYTLKCYDISSILNWAPLQTISSLDRGFLRGMMSNDSTVIAWGGHWAGTFQFFDISSGSLVTKCKVSTNGNNYNADRYQNYVYVENGYSGDSRVDISNLSSCSVSAFGGSCGGCPHTTSSGFIVYGPRQSACNPQRIEIYNQSNVLTGSLTGTVYSPALCLPDDYVLVNNFTISKQVLYNIYDGTFNHPVDTVFNNTLGGYLFNNNYIFRFINDSCEVYSRFNTGIQASNITFSNVLTNQITANWTDGNGTKRAVFMKQDSVGSPLPLNNTTYTASAIFGSGTQIGTSGWYCVFNGTTHSPGVIVTNLIPNTKYRVLVCEYYGNPGSELYNTSAAINNPMNVNTLSNSCPGIPTVLYGGKTYHTVQIGTQCWFKENLNIGTRINGNQEQTNNTILEKYCFNDLESNCDIYGGLYQWAEMVQYFNGGSNTASWSPVPSGSVQGICPSGWHLPNESEWCSLTSFIDPTVNCNVMGYSGTDIGGKMKESGTNHWASPNTGATNSSGFTTLPGGYRAPNYSYINLNIDAFLSSCSEYSSTSYMFRGLAYNHQISFRGNREKTQGSSVRCLKDTCTSYSAVGVFITPSSNPVCSGTSVTFTATPTNGGSSPVYQWKKGGTGITGATNSTYTYVPANNDVITCVLTSNVNCPSGNPATSNSITMTVNPNLPVSVSISASANSVCSSTSVIFTATPTNGGSSPVYQWKKGGTSITGATNLTYTYVPANGDLITCLLTSNAECVSGNPAISNSIQMSVISTPEQAGNISGPSEVCVGTQGVIYSVDPILNATNYLWEVPIGVSIASGAGTNSITVNFPSSTLTGAIYVKGTNACFNGVQSPSLMVTANALLTGQVTLTNITIPLTQQECLAAQSITIAGSGTTFLVEGGGEVTLIASQYIRFLPGTTVRENGLLHAFITSQCIPCSSLNIPLSDSSFLITTQTDDKTLETNNISSIMVYPNPTSGSFTLVLKGEIEISKVRVEIYSMRGEQLLTKELIGEHRHVFSLSDRPVGVYFIRVITGTRVETIKVVKQ